MKKSILLAAMILLVIGTSCSFSGANKEVNKAMEEMDKGAKEIEEIIENNKEIGEDIESKFDNDSNKDIENFNKDDELDEDEKDLEDDDDDSEVNEPEEPEDPKDLEFLSYDGVYFGVWTTQQGFTSPLSITVSGGTVTGFADFFMEVPGGQSTSQIAFSGTVNDAGLMDGIISGSGVLTGQNMASTMEMSGSFLGPIEGNTMTISYNSTAQTYIKDYGVIPNSDGGTIRLEKIKTQ